MKYATTSGPRIHYQDSGGPSRPPLLVLNGWAGSGLVWPQAWVGELERDFRLLRVCNRGTGKSDVVEAPFSVEDMARDTLAVLDSEGLDSAHVFGLSMGGMIAQTIAIEHPDRVRGLVLAGTAPPHPEFVAASGDSLATLFAPLRGERIGRDGYGKLWEAIAGPGFAQRGAAVLDQLVRDGASHPPSLAVVMLQYQAISGFREPSRLSRVNAPTLVVHGADDPLLPVENGRKLARLIPGARYEELPGVGHLVPYEAPERLTALMREVLL